MVFDTTSNSYIGNWRFAKRKNANHKALPLRETLFSWCPLISQGRPRPLRFCFGACHGPASAHAKVTFERGGTGSHQSGAPTTVERDPPQPPSLSAGTWRDLHSFFAICSSNSLFLRKKQWFFDFFTAPENFAICTKFFPQDQKRRDLHTVFCRDLSLPSFFPRFVTLSLVLILLPRITFMRNGWSLEIDGHRSTHGLTAEKMAAASWSSLIAKLASCMGRSLSFAPVSLFRKEILRSMQERPLAIQTSGWACGSPCSSFRRSSAACPARQGRWSPRHTEFETREALEG